MNNISFLYGKNSKEIYHILITQFPVGNSNFYEVFKIIDNLSINLKYSKLLFEYYFSNRSYSNNFPYVVFSKKVNFENIVEIIENCKDKKNYSRNVYHFLPFLIRKRKTENHDITIRYYQGVCKNIQENRVW